MIWENIKEMILNISSECLSLLKRKINKFFNAIVKNGVDFSPLKSHIEK